jgi:hypothetical protein
MTVVVVTTWLFWPARTTGRVSRSPSTSWHGCWQRDLANHERTFINHLKSHDQPAVVTTVVPLCVERQTICWRDFHPLEWQLVSLQWSGRASQERSSFS